MKLITFSVFKRILPMVFGALSFYSITPWLGSISTFYALTHIWLNTNGSFLEACPRSDHWVPVTSNESVPVPSAPRIFSMNQKNSAPYHNGATGPPPPPPPVNGPAALTRQNVKGIIPNALNQTIRTRNKKLSNVSNVWNHTTIYYTESNSATIANKAPLTKGLQLSQQEELKLKVAERRRRMRNDSDDDSS